MSAESEYRKSERIMVFATQSGCLTCIFSAGFYETAYPRIWASNGNGECRRHAPVIHETVAEDLDAVDYGWEHGYVGEPVTAWPEVQVDSWCGDRVAEWPTP